MRSFAPCVVVIAVGLLLGMGAVVAMATEPSARGGHAMTTKAPTPPQSRQSRGIVMQPNFYACSAPGGVCVRVQPIGTATLTR